jgi:type II secretory pathway component GspD/PulD (secretin)
MHPTGAKDLLMAARIFGLVAAVLCVAISCAEPTAAQTVQLPTVDTFTANTTVIVPDGGTIVLGSIGSSSMGEVGRGVPLLGNLPGVGRAFRNRASGQETGARSATVSSQIISLREMEPQILAEGNRRLQAAEFRPSPQTQRRAEFLSRHIGQSGQRR